MLPETSQLGEGVSESKVRWQDVVGFMEQCRLRGERFTSQKDFAERIGCSKATVNRAIRETPSLREWASRPKASAINAESIEGRVLDSMAQRRESDPANILESPDIDAALAYLIDQANPEERARIHEMTPDQRRLLAETAYRDPDSEEQIRRHRRVKRPTND